MPGALIQRFAGVWARVTGSLWFLPGLIVFLFVIASTVVVETSSAFDDLAIELFPRLFAVTPDSARMVLSAIAGSVITVAGVTFSILVVAVSQASSQYTPRVLRNFMRDRLSQVTLGVLVGVFLYCLVVLHTIRGDDHGTYVPAIAVSVAVALAFAAVALLMYFIHHIASTLEAGSMVASVAEETVAAIDSLFPEPLGAGFDGELGQAHLPAGPWRIIASDRTGYIQYIEVDGLMQLAVRHDSVIRMERSVGEFVAEGQALASICGAGDAPCVDAELTTLYHVETYRSVQQDAAFGIRQIVDIALKALSPGINDITTAIMCVQYLTAILLRAVSRRDPSQLRFCEGVLRVIARGATFEDLLADAFDEIRLAGRDNARLLINLACSLETLVAVSASATRRAAIRRHVRRVQAAIRSSADLEQECAPGLAACARALEGD